MIWIEHDEAAARLIVRVDRQKIFSHGKPAISKFLLRLHAWRCIPNPVACRTYYEELTVVSREHESWRKIVCAKPEPHWKFVQANTFRHGDHIEVKVYDQSNAGIIRSWAERDV